MFFVVGIFERTKNDRLADHFFSFFTEADSEPEVPFSRFCKTTAAGTRKTKELKKNMSEEEQYSWAVWKGTEEDKKPLGVALADKFANLLEKKEAPRPGHRDYGGTTFVCQNGKFGIASVYDGETMFEESKLMSKEDFVDWLSKKSEYQLQGFDEKDDLFENSTFYRGNQHFGVKDIKAFVGMPSGSKKKK